MQARLEPQPIPQGVLEPDGPTGFPETMSLCLYTSTLTSYWIGLVLGKDVNAFVKRAK